MTVTNDPTGRRSTCTRCGAEIEEALLLKGMRDRYVDPKDGRVKYRLTTGVPTWRTPDRGHGSAVCPSSTDRVHQPGRIRMVSAR